MSVSPPGLASSGVARLQQAARARLALAVTVSLGLAVLGGLAAGAMSYQGRAAVLLAAGVLLLPIILWRWPRSALAVIAVSATLFDALPDSSPDAITARVGLWRSLQGNAGLNGLSIVPFELLVGLVLLTWLAQAILVHRVRLPRSKLAAGIGTVLAIMLLAEIYGLSRGGVLQPSSYELRPWIYLAATFFIASRLVTVPRTAWPIFWGMVVGTGLKSIEGVERVITLRGAVAQPESLLEHDESVFFTCFLLLTLILWIMGVEGWLRRLATSFVPLVLIADLGNNRRAAWIMLPAAVAIVLAVTAVRLPHRRRLIAGVAAGLVLVGLAYVLALRHSPGIYAQPARAIWSNLQPDPRDAASNLYRQLENENLLILIHRSPIVGTGLGISIPYYVPLFDASKLDPLIRFIPHNNVLYLWMRTGTIGALAFWWMIGAAVIAAARLARGTQRDAALLGTLALVMIVCYLVQGWLDVGLVSFRIVALTGTVLGAVEGLRSYAAPDRNPAAAARRPEAVGRTARRRVLTA